MGPEETTPVCSYTSVSIIYSFVLYVFIICRRYKVNLDTTCSYQSFFSNKRGNRFSGFIAEFKNLLGSDVPTSALKDFVIKHNLRCKLGIYHPKFDYDENIASIEGVGYCGYISLVDAQETSAFERWVPSENAAQAKLLRDMIFQIHTNTTTESPRLDFTVSYINTNPDNWALTLPEHGWMDIQDVSIFNFDNSNLYISYWQYREDKDSPKKPYRNLICSTNMKHRGSYHYRELVMILSAAKFYSYESSHFSRISVKSPDAELAEFESAFMVMLENLRKDSSCLDELLCQRSSKEGASIVDLWHSDEEFDDVDITNSTDVIQELYCGDLLSSDELSIAHADRTDFTPHSNIFNLKKRALLLGMVNSNKIFDAPVQGQEYRDKLRCVALEEDGYEVFTMDDKHNSSEGAECRHCKSNFCDERKMVIWLNKIWNGEASEANGAGVTTLITMQMWYRIMEFDYIILDYFFSPQAWASVRWTKHFFTKALPSWVTNGMLSKRGCSIWLPNFQWVARMINEHGELLKTLYNIHYVKDPMQNPLYRATNSTDCNKKLSECMEVINNHTQVNSTYFFQENLFIVLSTPKTKSLM